MGQLRWCLEKLAMYLKLVISELHVRTSSHIDDNSLCLNWSLSIQTLYQWFTWSYCDKVTARANEVVWFFFNISWKGLGILTLGYSHRTPLRPEKLRGGIEWNLCLIMAVVEVVAIVIAIKTTWTSVYPTKCWTKPHLMQRQFFFLNRYCSAVIYTSTLGILDWDSRSFFSKTTKSRRICLHDLSTLEN